MNQGTAEGCREIFESLYREHQGKIYHLAMGLTGNEQDAEEITQETFCRAFRAYHSFQGESSFFTWIYRIGVNVAHDYLRQRKKLRVYELTEDMGYVLEEIADMNPSHDPETELLAREAKFRCLHGFTECLPKQQRKVFCLAVTVGLPHKLVAEILECSVSSVKTTLHRAKKRIAGYMEERCQYVKKSNPCNCAQWIRYGKEKGWITEKHLREPRADVLIEAKNEMVGLCTLRSVYRNLYREEGDLAMVQRVQKGLQREEWGIFS